MKRILALVLAFVMLFVMASCNLIQGTGFQESSTENTTSEVTTPEVTTPEGTTPEGTTPEGTTPEVTTPEVTTPEVTTPEGTTPEGTTPEGTTLEGTTPEESVPEVEVTIPEFEVSLPEVSKVIANIIGAVAASVEVSKDAQFVVVLEEDEDYTESNGYKQVLFFEIAEAAIDSNGELLKASLKVKIGEAVVMGPQSGSVEDIVVGKEDITSYYECSIVVNGDDVSVSVNDQNASQNLSELLYGTIAQMMGLESVEALEAMLAEAQKNAYIAQALEEKLVPMIVAALGGAMQELPTVSPAYTEHLAELFASIAQDIYTVTTDDVTGNTTYTLNIAALKALLSEIEDKTLTEYLESVYGKNIVASLSAFLKSLPDKKVKDIVDVAVSLAETTGSDIQEIYALIDLYVYSATGVEFSIEEQINTRYNDTLVALLAEYNGVQPEDEADFTAYVKKSFEQVANSLETVSIDALLSGMFMGTEEGFIAALQATIDNFDEQIVYSYTFDAEGYVVAITYGIGALQYNLVINGEATVITLSFPNGSEVIWSVENGTSNLIINQNGEQIAIGNITVTEEVVDEDTITTVEFDFCYGEDDLLDVTIVSVNDVVTQFDVVLRGYYVEEEWVETPMTEEEMEKFFEEMFGVGGNIESDIVIQNPEDGSVSVIPGGGFVTVTPVPDGTVSGDVIYGEVVFDGTLMKGEWVRTETFVTWLTVEYDDNGDESVLKIGAHESIMSGAEYITITASGNQISAVFTQEDEVVVNATVSFTENSLHLDVNNPYGSVFNAGIEITDNAEGEDFVRIEWLDLVSVLGYEFTESGMKFTMYDENVEDIFAMFEVVNGDENFVHVIFGGEEFKFIREVIDNGVKITLSDEVAQNNIVVLEIVANEQGELVIDIDLSKLYMFDYEYRSCYIAFDGAIIVKVA